MRFIEPPPVETPVVHAGEETGVPFLWQERGSLQPILDFSHHMCYHVKYEAETSLQISVLSDRRAKANPCSYLWLCSFCLQLGFALAHGCLLSRTQTCLVC